MSSVIDFLEKMGQDARLRDASPDELERALVEARIEPGLHSAILAGDASRLQILLGQDPPPPIQFGEEEPKDDGKDEEGEDKDDKEQPSPQGDGSA